MGGEAHAGYNDLAALFSDDAPPAETAPEPKAPVEIFAEWVEQFDNPAWPVIQEARRHEEAGRDAEALACLERGLETSDDQRLWTALALLLLNRFQQYARAFACLEHVHIFEGSVSGKLLLQGVLCCLERQHEQALELFEGVKLRDLNAKRECQFYFYRGLALAAVGRKAEARASLQRAGKLLPEGPLEPALEFVRQRLQRWRQEEQRYRRKIFFVDFAGQA